jgi:Rrf2 family protein
MKFSTKSRYALRLMIDLAKITPDGFVSLKEIAGRQGISVKYLEQIVTLLTRAGLLVSSRGPKGGHMLARRPAEYTVGDIIRAIEGRLAPVACLENTPNECGRSGFCEALGFWTGLQKVVNDYLDSVTLEQLARSGIDCPIE